MAKDSKIRLWKDWGQLNAYCILVLQLRLQCQLMRAQSRESIRVIGEAQLIAEGYSNHLLQRGGERETHCKSRALTVKMKHDLFALLVPDPMQFGSFSYIIGAGLDRLAL